MKTITLDPAANGEAYKHSFNKVIGLNLENVPFSRFGSYFSFGVHDWGPLG